MDPPRTRSRSRSGFFHFGPNGGGNSGGNAVGNGSLMNASGVGVNYPQQNNPGWASHHGGRSHPDTQQHTQGSYLSAGAQRHSAHGAHRHPGAGKQASVNRACSSVSTSLHTVTTPEGQRQTSSSLTGVETFNMALSPAAAWAYML